MMSGRWGAWLGGLFLLGLAPRLALLSANPSGLEFWEYETLAQNIAGGNGYLITHFGQTFFAFGDGNLYSFLSAAVYVLVGHQPMVLAVVQALLASLAAPVIFAIGRRAFGSSIAVLGAALAALHPGLLAYTFKLHPLGIDALLMAITVLWISQDVGRARTAFGTGLALGVTLMSRPTSFVGGLLAFALRWLGSPRRFVSLVLPVVVALAVATPWVVRNWAVLGRPLFVSTSIEDVWKGNNRFASGSSYVQGGRDVLSVAPAPLQARIRSANELQHNDVFAGEIVDFVRQEPTAFASLTLHKFVYFWWITPQEGLLYPTSWLGEYAVYLIVVATFGVIGSIAILRSGNSEQRSLLATLAAISLTIAVIHALSYVEGRHRWSVEPLLLLLTARGIYVVVDAVRCGRLPHFGQRSPSRPGSDTATT